MTASVNVVQSSFPDNEQGDISGVSRSVSNLGSSLGVAFAGSILVGAASPGNKEYAIAIVMLGIAALIGLVAAFLLPKRRPGEIATGRGPAPSQSSPADEAHGVHRS